MSHYMTYSKSVFDHVMVLLVPIEAILDVGSIQFTPQQCFHPRVQSAEATWVEDVIQESSTGKP